MVLEIDKPLLASLLNMATLIEARDAYTGGHTWRVSQYARLLADSIGVEKDISFMVQVGALVHDIGKVGISDLVLHKPGPLDENEFAAMKEHPAIGIRAVAGHPLEQLVLPAIAEHHERIDGRGYPATRHDDISVIGRILSIADAFDAMTSTRPYRIGMEKKKGLSILKECSGTQFDDELVEKFLHLDKKGLLEHILGHSSDSSLLLSCPMCGPIIVVPSHAQDGDHTLCPNCTGEYVLNKSGDGFEAEFTGVVLNMRTPLPDAETVETILRSCLPRVKIPA